MAKDEKQKVLRVGIIQDKRVVEERLMRKHSSVSIGQGPKNTFIVPSPSVPRTWTLFEALPDGGYALVFTPDIDGKIDLGGRATSLSDLVSKGRPAGRL